MKILRKAQLEVSFNWIFVLLAGGAILFVFIMIARKGIDNNEVTTSSVVSVKLQSLLSAVQQNPDAIQKSNQSLKEEMEFECTEEGHTYIVKGSTAKSYLASEVLFTPRKVGDSRTIAWTMLYSSPYPVVNVLYFTDEETLYIFNRGSPISNEYYNKFPEQFERKLLSSGEIEALSDQGFRKYIIVTGSNTPLTLDSSMKKKSTIVGISDNKVEFIYDGISNEVPYIGDETLFGAIISGDYKLYGCTMEKLMHVSRIVGEINLNRTEALSETENQKCKLFFNSNIPQSYIGDIIRYSVYPADGDDYTNLKDIVTSLRTINRDMAKSNCITIY